MRGTRCPGYRPRCRGIALRLDEVVARAGTPPTRGARRGGTGTRRHRSRRRPARSPRAHLVSDAMWELGEQAQDAAGASLFSVKEGTDFGQEASLEADQTDGISTPSTRLDAGALDNRALAEQLAAGGAEPPTACADAVDVNALMPRHILLQPRGLEARPDRRPEGKSTSAVHAGSPVLYSEPVYRPILGELRHPRDSHDTGGGLRCSVSPNGHARAWPCFQAHRHFSSAAPLAVSRYGVRNAFTPIDGAGDPQALAWRWSPSRRTRIGRRELLRRRRQRRMDRQREHLVARALGMAETSPAVAEVGEARLQMQRRRVVDLGPTPRRLRCARRASRRGARITNW